MPASFIINNQNTLSTNGIQTAPVSDELNSNFNRIIPNSSDTHPWSQNYPGCQRDLAINVDMPNINMPEGSANNSLTIENRPEILLFMDFLSLYSNSSISNFIDNPNNSTFAGDFFETQIGLRNLRYENLKTIFRDIISSDEEIFSLVSQRKNDFVLGINDLQNKTLFFSNFLNDLENAKYILDLRSHLNTICGQDVFRTFYQFNAMAQIQESIWPKYGIPYVLSLFDHIKNDVEEVYTNTKTWASLLQETKLCLKNNSSNFFGANNFILSNPSQINDKEDDPQELRRFFKVNAGWISLSQKKVLSLNYKKIIPLLSTESTSDSLLEKATEEIVYVMGGVFREIESEYYKSDYQTFVVKDIDKYLCLTNAWITKILKLSKIFSNNNITNSLNENYGISPKENIFEKYVFDNIFGLPPVFTENAIDFIRSGQKDSLLNLAYEPSDGGDPVFCLESKKYDNIRSSMQTGGDKYIDSVLDVFNNEFNTYHIGDFLNKISSIEEKFTKTIKDLDLLQVKDFFGSKFIDESGATPDFFNLIEKNILSDDQLFSKIRESILPPILKLEEKSKSNIKSTMFLLMMKSLYTNENLSINIQSFDWYSLVDYAAAIGSDGITWIRENWQVNEAYLAEAKRIGPKYSFSTQLTYELYPRGSAIKHICKSPNGLNWAIGDNEVNSTEAQKIKPKIVNSGVTIPLQDRNINNGRVFYVDSGVFNWVCTAVTICGDDWIRNQFGNAYDLHISFAKKLGAKHNEIYIRIDDSNFDSLTSESEIDIEDESALFYIKRILGRKIFDTLNITTTIPEALRGRDFVEIQIDEMYNMLDNDWLFSACKSILKKIKEHLSASSILKDDLFHTKYEGQVDNLVLLTAFDMIFNVIIYLSRSEFYSRSIGDGVDKLLILKSPLDEDSSEFFEKLTGLTSSVNSISAIEKTKIRYGIISIISYLRGLKNTFSSIVNKAKSSLATDSLSKIYNYFSDSSHFKNFLKNENQINLLLNHITEIKYKLSQSTDQNSLEIFNDSFLRNNAYKQMKNILNLDVFSNINSSKELKIMSIGIPRNIHNILKDTIRPDRKIQDDIVKISIYKIDHNYPLIIFKPLEYLFELSRFVARDEALIKDLDKKPVDLMESVGLYATRDRSQVVSSNSELVQYLKHEDESKIAFRGRDYDYLTQSQKNEIFKNHVLSHIIGNYCYTMSGLDLNEMTLDMESEAYKNLIGDFGEKLQISYIKKFLKKNNIQTPEFNSIDELNSFIISLPPTMKQSIQYTLNLINYLNKIRTNISDFESLAKGMCGLKYFDRVFNVIFNPNDFYIDYEEMFQRETIQNPGSPGPAWASIEFENLRNSNLIQQMPGTNLWKMKKSSTSICSYFVNIQVL